MAKKTFSVGLRAQNRQGHRARTYLDHRARVLLPVEGYEGVGGILMWHAQVLGGATSRAQRNPVSSTYNALIVSPPLPMTRPTIALGQSMHAVCFRLETSVMV